MKQILRFACLTLSGDCSEKNTCEQVKTEELVKRKSEFNAIASPKVGSPDGPSVVN